MVSQEASLMEWGPFSEPGADEEGRPAGRPLTPHSHTSSLLCLNLGPGQQLQHQPSQG